ncbi:hypothetical protein [Neorhodopirellula lusitana]
MIARLDQEAIGKLVIELVAMPAKGANSQFFWSLPARGFNGIQQTKRALKASDQTNAYLFAIPGDGPIRKLRFDPFATYDQYADVGEMMIQSIAIYQLAD